jgi:hypothetical protein
MWNRACPLCFGRVPRSRILAQGEDLVCPACRAPLELSRVSRVVSATAGLFAGFTVGQIAFGATQGSDWVLPVVRSVLAYGIGSTLVLYFLADLVVQPRPPGSRFPQAQK